MSVSMSRVSGSPLGSFQPSRAPGIGDAIRSLLSLLWIEIRRSQGCWLLPLMLLPVGLLNAFRMEQGVILWSQMTILTLETYIVIGPLAAGLGAWTADRDRRRRTTGMVDGAPRNPLHRDAAQLGAATFWGLVAYGVVACWFLGRGVLFATWGSPDLGIVLVGAVAVAAHAALGYLFGRVFPGRLAPLLAAILTYAAPIVSEMIDSATQSSRLGLAVPVGLVNFNDRSVHYKLPETYVGESLLWVAGILGALWMVIALLRSRHPVWWLGLAASVAIGVIGLGPLLSPVFPTTPGSESFSPGLSAEEQPLMTSVPFEPVCRSGTVVAVCVHPAYSARLEDTSERFDRILKPVAGLPGIPAIMQQYDDTALGQPPSWNVFHGFGDGSIAGAALNAVTLLESRYGLSDAQLVIARWMVERADMSYPFEPAAPAIDAAVDRFAALSPDAQRAWLEANWDALRAGTLTLEDLP